MSDHPVTLSIAIRSTIEARCVFCGAAFDWTLLCGQKCQVREEKDDAGRAILVASKPGLCAACGGGSAIVDPVVHDALPAPQQTRVSPPSRARRRPG